MKELKRHRHWRQSSVPSGLVAMQFAANFEQHSEGADPALFGQIRYNSTIAIAPTPLPPAVWLFGSGLLGLIGVARRKKSA